MLIANESNWRTEDLKALVDQITGIQEFKKGYHVRDDTLLFFKTLPANVHTSKVSVQGIQVRNPAKYYRSHTHYFNTVIVEIRTAKALKMDLLDRLSLAISDAKQDMHPDCVLWVADAIWRGLSSTFVWESTLGWARNFNMRATTKNGKSRLPIERRIKSLQIRREQITRAFQAQVRDIEWKIGALEEKKRSLK